VPSPGSRTSSGPESDPPVLDQIMARTLSRPARLETGGHGAAGLRYELALMGTPAVTAGR